MECPCAANHWVAHDHFLAGAWTASAKQDSLWRLPSPWRQRPRSLEAAHERSLGADDTRGAREVSQRNALRPRSLRLIRGASGMNKFDGNATSTGEDAEPDSYKGPSSSIHYRPAANYNDRLAELEIENSRLHRLVAELLIKN